MVGTLIVAAAAGTTAAGVAASFALTAAAFAVNFAVSMIVTRMFGDNPERQQDMGVRQQVPPSSVNAIPIVYGDAYMGGTFVDAVLTTDQKTMYYVVAISSISSANSTLGTSAGVFNYNTTTMYYGDRLITFDGTDLTKVVSLTDEAGNVDTKISGNLYINLYKSSSAGVITPVNGTSLPSVVMGGSDISVAQRWTGTRQMNNLAFAIIKLVYNRDADTTQLNPITFNVSHYPNGASVAKPGDVWLDYITNQDYGGAVGWLPDGSYSAAFVDTACVTTLNTYSDQTITYTPAGGGSTVTQARYRINGVLDAGQSVLSNLDRIMSSCDSWMTYNAALGQWSVVVNKAETAAYAFTDNNIVGDIRVSATDITSSINQVEARFPFKANRDQASFVNIETPYALLYPNEPVNKYSITYDLVNDSVQAQYLANRLLEQAREDLIVSFSTTYYGIQVDAGNVVSVTNSDYGWNAKLFRVMKVNEASLPDGSLGAKLELSEYNAQVYDDASIQQFTPAPNSGLPSVSYFSPLAAPTVTGFPSATIPYINVQVFIPTTGRVTFGSLFWTTSATPTPADWKLVTTAATTNNQPVTNGSYYTFANITLNTGTYYFAYNVGNDITTSILSPISAALVWNPVAGAGPTGPTGASVTGPTGASVTGPTGPTGTGPTGSNGLIGLSSLTAYRVQSQSDPTPTFTTPTTGPNAPSGWSLTTPSVAVGQVLWYIQGRYNANAVTVDGVGAGQTAWTGPIAASVFQDIRSDNWDGGVPTTNAPTGTVGYYIKQSNGNMYLNSIFGRGVVQFDGATAVPSGSGGGFAAATFNTSNSAKFGVYGESNNATGAGLYGFSNNTSNSYAYGVWGQIANPNSSAVYGYNYATTGGYGVNGTANGSTSVGVLGNGNTGVVGQGLYGAGVRGLGLLSGYSIDCQTGFRWGLYTYAQPPGTGGYALLDNGTWGYPTSATNATYADYLGGYIASSWARIFPTNSGTANAGGSGVNLLGSTSTGIAGAYVGTSGTSNIVTWTVQTTSPSDIRLKEQIVDSDLGLAFVKQLRPVSYKLKADPKHQKGYGFIAQEVETLIGGDSSLVYHEPDWKVGDETGFKTIHYPSYIAVLTKAIQELTAKVETLEAKLKG
jgi:hypothetical protein